MTNKQDERLLTPEEREYVVDKAKLTISGSMGWSDRKKTLFIAEEVARAQLAKADKHSNGCPFCNDDGDYDLIGLKYHLANYCEAYQNTGVIGL